MGALLLLFVVGFPSVALFARDRPPEGRAKLMYGEGLTIREALGNYRFWFASLAMLLTAPTINGTIAYRYPAAER